MRHSFPAYWNAQKRVSRQHKSPRQLRRSGDAYTHTVVNFLIRGRPLERRSRIREQVASMHTAVNSQCAREFARAGTQILEGRHIAALHHGGNALSRLQSADQNKAILAPASDQKIQQPMHAVIQIDISRTRRVALHKMPRRRPEKRVTSLIVQHGISLGLNNHAANPVPNKLATNQPTRTSHRIAPKKICSQIHRENGF